MLNNNIRQLRDKSGLNFVLYVFRGHIGRVIQTAINGRGFVYVKCKVVVEKFKFLIYGADCINLGSTGKYFRKRRSVARLGSLLIKASLSALLSLKRESKSD